MSSSNRLFHVGDLCESVSISYSRNDAEVILINTSDVYDGKVISKELVPNKNLKGQFKKTFQKDDILFSEIRPANRRFAYIDFDDTERYIASTKLMVLRPNKSLIEPKFLFHLITSSNILSYLQHLAETRSGTFPQITFSTELAPIEINLPSLDDQRKILSVLTNIYAKIDSNNEEINLLEETIKTYFKGLFPYSPDEELPYNWKKAKLSDVTDSLRDKVGKENVKVLSAVNSGELVLSESYFTKQVFSKDIGKYIRVEPLQFAYNPARVNIGSIGMNEFDFVGCVSPVYVAFKVEKGYEYYFKYFIKSSYFKKQAIVRSSGSVRQSMNYTDFGLIEIAYPPRESVESFNDFYIIAEEKKRNLIHENKTLTAIYELIMPRLMSGELDVSSIKIEE